MRVIMVAAVSKDGYIADENGDVTKWTSPEDKTFFQKIKSEHPLYVMGSKTYDAIPKPLVGESTRVVLTSRKEQYKNEATEKVVFEHTSPHEFIKKFSKNFDSCLLLGGAKLYTDFLEAKLVDEVFLTVEPVNLGAGTSLLENGINFYAYPFTLESDDSINAIGTTLKHYTSKSVKNLV